MPGYKGPLNLNSHIFSDGAFGQGRCNFDTLDSNMVSTLFPILHSTIKQNTSLQTAMEDDKMLEPVYCLSPLMSVDQS
jgi:hypothetical protein